MNNAYWLECCEDQDFLDFLNELIGYNMIEENTPAYGITKMVIDGCHDELSPAQWAVFVNYVAEANHVEECNRQGCKIPWCEMVVALNNGGYCSYCAHMMNKDD